MPRSRPLLRPAAPPAFSLAATLLLATVLASPARAQRRAAPARRVPAGVRFAGDTVRPLSSDPALRGLRWRLVGPFRGGRVDAVAGDPVHPLTFYFGGVDGGVWKTANAGATWTNITDGRSDIASVGAIAVAPSDPNVIYAGAGESDPREDITYGDGMYRSTDAGETWQHIGLDDTRHIAAIRIDPTNPDVVYVAALGHAFGPNAERGVFRTRDGGRTWQKILFAGDSTGAIDLAMNPMNPRILYAATWKFQRFPWGFSAGGGRSGLWKTTDGGDHWTELTSAKGLPGAPVGRIGITVSPARPSRLWASVEAPDSTGGIFRSDDAGHTWKRVDADQKFMVRPWYFSGITADSKDPNTVYVLNLGTWRSIDAGKTFTRVHAPHGDDHILWIDPHDAARMIEGNDGGATVSLDDGVTWSTQYNQPTAQFYHVITDNRFPYRILGAQQDEATVSIASRSDAGAIGRQDWYSVAGGESGYLAPDPRDPNIVYAGSYMGTITRYDRRTHQARDVSPWMNNYDGWAAADVPNRFQWTFPIVFSPNQPGTLYTTANRVFRSTDDGVHWTVISPDLTRHDPKTLGPVGGPITHDATGTEWYGTIFTFAESPVAAGELWAGSDDGLIHLSRDGGATWQDVTPRGMKPFTRVSVIEPSHHDAGTAYVAANRYQLDDFHPYLYRTTDYGKSWTRIDAGIPVGAYTRTIREDPVRRGLLFAGTETGAYVSFDDGAHWQSLQLDLPRSSVRDFTIHGSDLIAATHGRSFWSLDDISPLRQVTDSVRHAAVHLFAPDTALRWLGGSRHPAGAGANPPDGAIIDYYFRAKPTGPVMLAFLDSTGKVIRTFHSKMKDTAQAAVLAAAGAPHDSRAASTRARAGTRDTAHVAPERRPATQTADSASYAPSDSVVAARAGANRFVWNLHYPPAHGVKHIVEDEGMLDGPAAVPGRYTVRLTVGGKSYTHPFVVVEDPRVKATPADLAAQWTLAEQIRDTVTALADAATRIAAMTHQLRSSVARAKGTPAEGQLAAAARALTPKLDTVLGEMVQVHAHTDESTLAYPVQLYNQLLTLNAMVQGADAAPTSGDSTSFVALGAALASKLDALHTLESTDVAAFNRMVQQLGVPAVVPSTTTAGASATIER